MAAAQPPSSSDLLGLQRKREREEKREEDDDRNGRGPRRVKKPTPATELEMYALRTEPRLIHEGEDDAFHNVESIDFSPDDRHVAVGLYENGVQIIDLESGKTLHYLYPGESLEHQVVLYSYDGSKLAMADTTEVSVVDLSTRGTPVICERWVESRITTMAFTHSGDKIAIGDEDGNVYLTETNSGQGFGDLEPVLKLGARINSLEFHHEGGLLIASVDCIALLFRHNPETGAWEQFQAYFHKFTPGITQAAHFTDGGRKIVICTHDSELAVFDTAQGAQKTVVPLQYLDGGLQHLPSISRYPGQRVLVHNNRNVENEFELVVYDATQGTELKRFQTVEEGVWNVTVSRSGRLVAAAAFRARGRKYGVLYVWDASVEGKRDANDVADAIDTARVLPRALTDLISGYVVYGKGV